MLDEDRREAIDALLGAIGDEPTVLPVAQIARVRATGVDIEIERRANESVVCVTPRVDERFDRLTPREREVAMLIAAGFSNQQVGAALFISLATVKDHVHSALRKMGLRSRSQIIAAWYGGLVEAHTEQ